MRILILGGLLVSAAAAGFAQPATSAAFEVASIKVSTEGPGHSGGHTSPGMIRFQNRTLRECIQAAYGVRGFQIEGGPKWLDEERYNIDAKAAGPAGDAELMQMVRTLLADRFHLEFHKETKPAQGYAMVPAKGGLKVKPDDTEGSSQSHSTRVSLDASHISMEFLASFVAERLGVPVADATGATGAFDVQIKWTPDEEVARAAGEAGRADRPVAATGETRADRPPSLPEVLTQQLGLKLEARKVPMEVLVIDRAEKPVEN